MVQADLISQRSVLFLAGRVEDLDQAWLVVNHGVFAILRGEPGAGD